LQDKRIARIVANNAKGKYAAWVLDSINQGVGMTHELQVPEGFKHYSGVSPAEDNVGPFYYRKDSDGLRVGFRVGAKHCNGMGALHGGVLLCFGDYAATMFTLSGVKENCLTISFNADFMAGVKDGEWLEATGEVVKRTGSLSFVRGQLHVEDRQVLVFQAVMRRLKKPD